MKVMVAIKLLNGLKSETSLETVKQVLTTLKDKLIVAGFAPVYNPERVADDYFRNLKYFKENSLQSTLSTLKLYFVFSAFSAYDPGNIQTSQSSKFSNSKDDFERDCELEMIPELIESLRKYKAEMEKEGITIGCDPEFACRLNKKSISASQLFYGDDDFGCDGYSQTAEIRPGYSKDPLEVVIRIQKLIKWAKEQHPSLQLFAGHHCDSSTLGGHIHFGGGIVRYHQNNLLKPNVECLCEAFQSFIEPKDQLRKRTQQGYGQRKAWRNQPWGIEYRSPLSWNVSPTIALAYLSLAKQGAATALQNIDLQHIKGTTGNRHFIAGLIKRFNKHNITLDKSCIKGITYAEQIAKNLPKINWDVDIIGNWIGDKYATD